MWPVAGWSCPVAGVTATSLFGRTCSTTGRGGSSNDRRVSGTDIRVKENG